MYYFIINPQSRSGKGRRIWKEVKRCLDKRNISYEACLTEGAGHARAIAQEITSTPKGDDVIIVVLGGDGTLNEVVDGMTFYDRFSLAYIPAGSGNDFARGLRLPKKHIRVLNRILNSQNYRYLDYGVLSFGDLEAQNRRFVVSAGIGFDAEVCHEILVSRMRRVLNRLHMGKLSYIIIGIKKLAGIKPSNGYMILDDTKRVDFKNVLFVSAHIHRYEGGGFAFAPKADPADGCLEICAVSNLPRRRLVAVLFFSLFGMHMGLRGVRTYRCREIRVHSDRPMAVHTDGESCGWQTDILARCIEKKVKLVV